MFLKPVKEIRKVLNFRKSGDVSKQNVMYKRYLFMIPFYVYEASEL